MWRAAEPVYVECGVVGAPVGRAVGVGGRREVEDRRGAGGCEVEEGRRWAEPVGVGGRREVEEGRRCRRGGPRRRGGVRARCGIGVGVGVGGSRLRAVGRRKKRGRAGAYIGGEPLVPRSTTSRD